MEYNLASSILNIKHIEFSSGKKSNEDYFNILYGVDKNYELGVAISIISILINNKSQHFHFHIFMDEISSDYRSNIIELAEKYATTITLYTINSEFFRQLPNTKVWSHAMYFRLLGLDYLSQEHKQALYLDADVVCKGSLSNLQAFNFNNLIAAVVPDILSIQERFTAEQSVIFPSDINYFNSGVMLVNLEQWRKHDITQAAINMLVNPDINKKLRYPDQDILNILLHNRTLYIDKKYNTIFTIKSELTDKTHVKYKSIITDDTILIHYTGITKPWHEWAVYDSIKFFDRAYVASPWSNIAKKGALSVVELQKKYKHKLKQRRYLEGVCSGLYYNFLKVKARLNKHD